MSDDSDRWLQDTNKARLSRRGSIRGRWPPSSNKTISGTSTGSSHETVTTQTTEHHGHYQKPPRTSAHAHMRTSTDGNAQSMEIVVQSQNEETSTVSTVSVKKKQGTFSLPRSLRLQQHILAGERPTLVTEPTIDRNLDNDIDTQFGEKWQKQSRIDDGSGHAMNPVPTNRDTEISATQLQSKESSNVVASTKRKIRAPSLSWSCTHLNRQILVKESPTLLHGREKTNLETDPTSKPGQTEQRVGSAMCSAPTIQDIQTSRMMLRSTARKTSSPEFSSNVSIQVLYIHACILCVYVCVYVCVCVCIYVCV